MPLRFLLRKIERRKPLPEIVGLEAAHKLSALRPGHGARLLRNNDDDGISLFREAERGLARRLAVLALSTVSILSPAIKAKRGAMGSDRFDPQLRRRPRIGCVPRV